MNYECFTKSAVFSGFWTSSHMDMVWNMSEKIFGTSSYVTGKTFKYRPIMIVTSCKTYVERLSNECHCALNITLLWEATSEFNPFLTVMWHSPTFCVCSFTCVLLFPFRNACLVCGVVIFFSKGNNFISCVHCDHDAAGCSLATSFHLYWSNVCH